MIIDIVPSFHLEDRIDIECESTLSDPSKKAIKRLRDSSVELEFHWAKREGTAGNRMADYGHYQTLLEGAQARKEQHGSNHLYL